MLSRPPLGIVTPRKLFLWWVEVPVREPVTEADEASLVLAAMQTSRVHSARSSSLTWEGNEGGGFIDWG